MNKQGLDQSKIHLTQIVVLPSSTNAFLAVGGALQLAEVAVGINGSQKDGLELKKQSKGRKAG